MTTESNTKMLKPNQIEELVAEVASVAQKHPSIGITTAVNRAMAKLFPTRRPYKSIRAFPILMRNKLISVFPELSEWQVGSFKPSSRLKAHSAEAGQGDKFSVIPKIGRHQEFLSGELETITHGMVSSICRAPCMPYQWHFNHAVALHPIELRRISQIGRLVKVPQNVDLAVRERLSKILELSAIPPSPEVTTVREEVVVAPLLTSYSEGDLLKAAAEVREARLQQLINSISEIKVQVQTPTPVPYRPATPPTEAPRKVKKPKIVIIDGMVAEIEQHLRQKIPAKMTEADFEFIHTDRSPRELVNAPHVFVICGERTNHAWYRTIESRISPGNLKYVRGGNTSILQEVLNIMSRYRPA